MLLVSCHVVIIFLSTGLSLQSKEEEQQAASGEAVFPCILKILPNCVFNAKDPIVLGVDVEEGIAKVSIAACDLADAMMICVMLVRPFVDGVRESITYCPGL